MIDQQFIDAPQQQLAERRIVKMRVNVRHGRARHRFLDRGSDLITHQFCGNWIH